MRETQTTVAQWAKETFGEVRIEQIATRLLCESGELLLSILTRQDPGKILDECADIGVMLLQVADRLDIFIDLLHTDSVSITYPDHLAASLNRELAQMTAGIVADPANLDPLRRQCALCASLLGNVSERFGEPVPMFLVERKMSRNRARTWAKDEHGLFQHTSEGKST